MIIIKSVVIIVNMSEGLCDLMRVFSSQFTVHCS